MAGATAKQPAVLYSNPKKQFKNPKNVQINLAELAIESFDHKQGRPSLIDINNVQMFEGNEDEDPYEFEHEGHQPGFTRPSEYSENFELSNTLGSQDCKLKFKKKSQIEQT